DCKSENAATIVGEKGSIVFGPWFHCSEIISLYDSNNNLIETKHFSHPRTGYEYEIMEVNRCLKLGLLESSLVPHSDTRAVMVMIDKIKEKIGLSYPDESI
ncbi:MAG: gfo/Idh/MocA family oxidoreductase, partial [Huintestinicola sp.]